MDGHGTSTGEMLQTLLTRTAVMQAQMQIQNESMLATLKLMQEGQQALAREVAVLRDGQNELRVTTGVMQAELKALNERMTYYATEAKVESVRTEVESVRTALHKAIEAQTWRLMIWMTAAGSGLVGATYYIARNVH
jgi:maltooligosyltrehalose synthase